MKILSILFLTWTISLSIVAQNKFPNYQVTGQIIEKISGDCVPYATIILKNDSIKEKKILACNVSGQFSINLSAPNKYILTVSAVGYKEFSIPVNVFELKTDLGKLSIKEGIELKEVVISAQKLLVKIDLDKIVYSMESDPEAQTNNTLEMLYKVPLVTVDAEGVGGILNIITNKKTIRGYNGSVSSEINSRGSINGSVYLATKIDKLSFSLRYYGNQFRQPKAENNTTSEYYNNTDYHYSNSNGNSSYKGFSNGYSGEASYEIDSLNLISLSFWGYQGSYKDITFFSRNEYIQLAQTIRFNATFNFGKMDLQVKKASRGIQNDDVKNGGSNKEAEKN